MDSRTKVSQYARKYTFGPNFLSVVVRKCDGWPKWVQSLIFKPQTAFPVLAALFLLVKKHVPWWP